MLVIDPSLLVFVVLRPTVLFGCRWTALVYGTTAKMTPAFEFVPKTGQYLPGQLFGLSSPCHD